MSMRHHHEQDLTVANTANDSDEFASKGLAEGTIQLPAAIDGTTLNFKVSNDGSTFSVPLVGGSALADVTVSAGDVVEVPPVCFKGKEWKVSFTTAQTAERTIKVVARS